MDELSAATEGLQGQLQDRVIGERVGTGQLEALAPVPAAVEGRDDAIGDVVGPDRLVRGAPGPRDGHDREQRHPLEHAHPRVTGGVDDRRREDGVLQAGPDDRPLGQGLGPEEARAAARRGPHHGEEHEPLDVGAFGGLNHPPGRNPVELLDRAARLVASRGGQVDHGADAAQGVAEGLRVREVPESDLDAHALGAQVTRVADEAADGLAMRGQAPQEGRAHHAGGTREQDHGRRSLGAAGTEPGARTA